MKEEVKKILHALRNEFNAVSMWDKDIESYTDKILALSPFEKLERVFKAIKVLTEYTYTDFEDDQMEWEDVIRQFYDNFQYILNEKPFDMRKWLENNKSLFQRDNTLATWETRTIIDGNTYVFELGITYLQITQLVWSVTGKRIEQNVYLYKGSIPTSRYFFEELLKSLNIEL